MRAALLQSVGGGAGLGPGPIGGSPGRGAAALTQGLLLSIAAAAAIFAAAALFPLRDVLLGGPTLCPVRLSTGLLCPGCGSTRAFVAGLHGDLLGALAANPLATLASPFLIIAFVKQAGRLFDEGAVGRTYVASRWIWALFAVVVLYTVLRNLPWAPFTALAP